VRIPNSTYLPHALVECAVVMLIENWKETREVTDDCKQEPHANTMKEILPAFCWWKTFVFVSSLTDEHAWYIPQEQSKRNVV